MSINWLRRDGDVAGSIEKNAVDSENLSLATNAPNRSLTGADPLELARNVLPVCADVIAAMGTNTIENVVIVVHAEYAEFTDSDLGQHAINGMPLWLVRVTLVKHLINRVHAPNRIMVLKEANKNTLTGK